MSLFDIPKVKSKMEELEAKTLEENFWKDSDNSANVLAQIKN